MTHHSSSKQYLHQLSDELADYSCPDIVPVRVARDILSSMLQKALRRADRDHALSAAHGLIAEEPALFWRRLTGIAFEDFGHSNLSLTHLIVAVAASGSARKSLGDLRLASYLIEKLTLTPKDRRVDDLYMLAIAHIKYEAYHRCAPLSPAARELLSRIISLCLTCERPVPRRSIRAVIPQACDEAISRLHCLPVSVARLCVQARKTSGCLLPAVMAHSLASEPESPAVDLEVTDLPTQAEGGTLLPSIDGYTALGRTILTQLVREENGLSQVLRYASGISREKSAAMLLFSVEGGLLRSSLSTPLTKELRAAAHGCWSGLPPPLLPEALQHMRLLLPAINDRRRDSLKNHNP
jgi:hypothetical protein